MFKASKKIIIFASAILICILFVAVFFLSTTFNFFDSKIPLVSVYDYTEQSILVSEFSQKDQQAINDYLERCHITDDKSEGFGLIHKPDPNMFEKLYFNYKLCKTVNNGGLSEEYLINFKKIFHNYEIMIDNYGITAYDYFYYVCIKCELEEGYDQESLFNILLKHKNKDTNLIFYRTATDGLSTELLITSKIISLAKIYKIDLHQLNFEESIRKQLNDYNFNSKEGKLYESGGSVIFAAKEYPSLAKQITKKYDWYKTWKVKYEKFHVTDMTSLIEYSSFLTIAQEFEEISDSKIKEYLLSLKDIDIDLKENESLDDGNLYDYIFKNYNTIISKQYRKKILDWSLGNLENYYNLYQSSQNINIGDTFYGLSLANLSKFHCNGQRILQTINKIYQEVSSNCNDREYVYNTYYYMMIKSSYNNGIIEINEANSISKQIDDILDRMLEKPNEIDISCLRVALEIKSNARSYILNSHKNDIKKLVEKYIKNPVNNSLAIEYIKIDKILALNVMNKFDFKTLKSTLFDKGGFKCKQGESPDIKTTFLFYSLISNHNIFYPSGNEKEELLIFLDRLKSKNGLYRYELNYSEKDLRSILYGYILKNGAGVASDELLPTKKG